MPTRTPPSFHIDSHTLRDIPDDVAAAQAYVAELEARGPDGDAERVPWLRMLGRLKEAEELGRAALDRAGGVSVRRGVAPALRLAHVLHWQDRFREADTYFDAGRTTAERLLQEAGRATADRLLQEAERESDRTDTGTAPDGDPAVGRDATDRARRWAIAMLYFADQHQGKARFDEGRTAEALTLFERALARREAESAPEDQIASTRQAVAAARVRLAAGE